MSEVIRPNFGRDRKGTVNKDKIEPDTIRTNYGVFIPQSTPMGFVEKNGKPLQRKTTNDKILDQAEKIILDVAAKTLSKINKKSLHYTNHHIQAAFTDNFQNIIIKHCNKIIEAAEKDVCSEMKIKKQLARNNLAKELLSARKRLKDITDRIANIENELRNKEKELYQKISCVFNEQYKKISTTEYCVPPKPFDHLIPDEYGTGLPADSGIYFLWNDDKIVYVGRSVKLCDRLKLRVHHVLKPHYRISFLLIDEQSLNWAEYYYIGLIKPELNFGKQRHTLDKS